MFEDFRITFKGGTLLLLMLSFAMSFSQIVQIAWCSASGPFYGYFYNESHEILSCVYNTPGDWFFYWGALGLNALGVWQLFYDFKSNREQWAANRRINISRILFTISFVSTNALLEALTRVYTRPALGSPIGIIFASFGYLLPISIFVLVVSSWTIINKVELYLDLNKRH